MLLCHSARRTYSWESFVVSLKRGREQSRSALLLLRGLAKGQRTVGLDQISARALSLHGEAREQRAA